MGLTGLRSAVVLALAGSVLIGCTPRDPAPGATTPALPTGTFAFDDPTMGDDRSGSPDEPLSLEPPEPVEAPDSLAAARRSKALVSRERVTEVLAVWGDEDWYRFTVTTDTRMQALLGDLPSNYSLTIYDAGGRKVVGSSRTGSFFQRVYWNARSGDYFARVAIAKGGRPARTEGEEEVFYTFRFRQLPAGVVTESWSPNGLGDQYVNMVGELVNATSSWMQVKAVYVDQLNDAGRVIQRAPVPLPVQVMQPYGKLAFSSDPVRINSKWAGWRISPDATPTRSRTVPRLSLTQNRPETAGNDITYSGRIHDDGTEALAADTALIVHRAFSGSGTLEHVFYDAVPAIPADGSVPYRFTVDVRFPPGVEVGLAAPIR